MMLAALGFVVVCALIASGVIEAGELFVAISYLGALFFGLCLLYIAWRLVAPKPSVIISERGVYDDASLINAGWIGWEEIEDIKISEQQAQSSMSEQRFMAKQRFLTIIPKDQWEILARQNLVKRYFMALNADQFFDSPINIPQVTVPMPLEELRSEILRFRREVVERPTAGPPGEPGDLRATRQDEPRIADEEEPRPAAGGDREGIHRPWWRRVLGG